MGVLEMVKTMINHPTYQEVPTVKAPIAGVKQKVNVLQMEEINKSVMRKSIDVTNQQVNSKNLQKM